MFQLVKQELVNKAKGKLCLHVGLTSPNITKPGF